MKITSLLAGLIKFRLRLRKWKASQKHLQYVYGVDEVHSKHFSRAIEGGQRLQKSYRRHDLEEIAPAFIASGL
jgi:hypothetical protein